MMNYDEQIKAMFEAYTMAIRHGNEGLIRHTKRALDALIAEKNEKNFDFFKKSNKINDLGDEKK